MMQQSAGQPVKDPQEFAQTYAGVVNDIIEQHKKQRIPAPWDQVDKGEESMAINAPGRQKDYVG